MSSWSWLFSSTKRIVGRVAASAMMSPAAGLHPDNAWRKLLRQSNQRLPPHLATHHNRAGRIQPNHAADVLAEVDAKHRDIHPFLLLIRRRAYDAGRRGGPFHKLCLIGAAVADSLLKGAGDSGDDGRATGDAGGAVLRLQPRAACPQRSPVAQ